MSDPTTMMEQERTIMQMDQKVTLVKIKDGKVTQVSGHIKGIAESWISPDSYRVKVGEVDTWLDLTEWEAINV